MKDVVLEEWKVLTNVLMPLVLRLKTIPLEVTLEVP
jgi:hypothetical protein